MKVLRSCLLLILLIATCHGFAIMKNFTANAPTMEEIRDDFVGGVSAAANDLQQSIVHKVRATGGAVSTLGGLNANLMRNFLANNYNFWTNLGNGVSTKSSQLWNYISNLRPNTPISMGSAGMPSLGMPGLVMPGSGMPGSGMPGPVMPGSGMLGPVMPGSGMPGSGMPGPVMPGSGMPGSGMPGSGALSSWLSKLGKPLIIFSGSNLMGPGTGSGPISSGTGSVFPGSGAGSGPISPGSGTGSGPASSGSGTGSSPTFPGSGTGSGSFFPESGTGTNSPSSKLERLRSKFHARPGCSLWESIKLPAPRQALENLARSNEPDAIVKALENDEFSENDEIDENNVVSS